MCNLWVKQGNVLKGLKIHIWPHNKLVLIMYMHSTSFKLKIYVGSSIPWDKWKKKNLLKFFDRVTCIKQCTLVRSLNLLKNWYTHIFLKMVSDKICQCSGEC